MAQDYRPSPIYVEPEARRLMDAAETPRWQRASFAILLLATLLVRLPGINRPLLGNFATRNVVQAMAARNWIRGESPWWRPTLDCLADGEPAWHLVEVPCSAYVSGLLWQTFGGSLDLWGRLTAAGWSLVSVALLYALVARKLGHEAGLAAGFVMAFSPISIIYGQSFLLEPSVAALTLVGWWATERYLATRRWIWLPALGAALAILWLTKIYMVAIALPLGWLCYTASPSRAQWSAFLATLTLAAIPVAWWCYQVWLIAGSDSATAGRVFYSLLGSAAEHRFPNPLLSSWEYPRQLVVDLFTVVLTPLAAFPLLFAFRKVEWRTWWPTALVMVLFVLLMPRKFFEMNYYHLIFLPAWAALLGLGWSEILDIVYARRWLLGLFMLGALSCAARYSMRPAFFTPAEDVSVLPAAEALQRLAATTDRVVTSHGSTLDLLYYCDRRGWTLPLHAGDFSRQLDEHRQEGAVWFVLAGEAPLQVPDDAQKALSVFAIAADGEGYRVYRLAPSRPPASTAMPNAPGNK